MLFVKSTFLGRSDQSPEAVQPVPDALVTAVISAQPSNNQ